MSASAVHEQRAHDKGLTDSLVTDPVRTNFCAPLQELTSKIAEVSCTWLQSIHGIRNLLVNPLLLALRVTVQNGAEVAGQTRAFFITAQFAKPLIGIADVLSKIPRIFEAIQFSAFYRTSSGGAEEATLFEKGLEGCARICDWVVSVVDTQNILANLKILDLQPRWIQVATNVMRFAAAFLSIYTIAVEAAKLYNGYNTKLADDATTSSAATYSILKIAMSCIYLFMAITGASLALQIAMASCTVAAHYFKHLVLSQPEQDARRGEVVFNSVLEQNV